ncbi:hypothetical protein Mapa_004589 [Marchantia paleacea]|nr:hypothetical protein Mapa_004589 [Marchantia paleacea]
MLQPEPRAGRQLFGRSAHCQSSPRKESPKASHGLDDFPRILLHTSWPSITAQSPPQMLAFSYFAPQAANATRNTKFFLW